MPTLPQAQYTEEKYIIFQVEEVTIEGVKSLFMFLQGSWCITQHNKHT